MYYSIWKCLVVAVSGRGLGEVWAGSDARNSVTINTHVLNNQTFEQHRKQIRSIFVNNIDTVYTFPFTPMLSDGP